MTGFLTDENRILMNGVILSLLIHGITGSLIRLRFSPKPEPSRPQMFFLGPIINSSGSKNQEADSTTEKTRNLLLKTEPKLLLQGIAPQKPSVFTGASSKKSYLKDNFLLKNKPMPSRPTAPQEDQILSLEPYRRLRLQN